MIAVSTAGAKIDFRDQLDAKFDLKYFSELKVNYELIFKDNDPSGYNMTKIGIADEDSNLTGYADGVAFAYTLEVGKTQASVSIGADVKGPAIGINVQPMDASYAWPEKLLEEM